MGDHCSTLARTEVSVRPLVASLGACAGGRRQSGGEGVVIGR